MLARSGILAFAANFYILALAHAFVKNFFKLFSTFCTGQLPLRAFQLFFRLISCLSISASSILAHGNLFVNDFFHFF